MLGLFGELTYSYERRLQNWRRQNHACVVTCTSCVAEHWQLLHLHILCIRSVVTVVAQFSWPYETCMRVDALLDLRSEHAHRGGRLRPVTWRRGLLLELLRRRPLVLQHHPHRHHVSLLAVRLHQGTFTTTISHGSVEDGGGVYDRLGKRTTNLWACTCMSRVFSFH